MKIENCREICEKYWLRTGRLVAITPLPTNSALKPIEITKKKPMVKKLSIQSAVLGACVALGTTLLATSSGMAGDEASGKESKTVTPTEAPATSWITGDGGATLINKYISRGIILEGDGVIVQPYMDMFFKVYDGKGFINTVSGQLSFWSSINSSHKFSPVGNDLQAWYEFDSDPGITVTFAKNFTYTVQYFEFDSPAGAFSRAQSINQTLAYNDSDYLGVWALHPHFTTLAEIRGKAGLGNTREQGWYFEEGVAPSYTFLPKSDYPITVTLPITAGEGTKEFYNGSNFGYVSAGPTVSVPLAFMPKNLGSWTASASYLLYYIGNGVADQAPVAAFFNNETGQADSENHKQVQNIFSATIGYTF